MLDVQDLACPFSSDGSGRGLREVALRVSAGELSILLGPNGSGKTTLLECIAGLRKIRQGQIRIGDKVLTHLPPHKRAQFVNLLSQQGGVGLPLRMTIGEVLGLWAERGRSVFGFLHSSVDRRKLAGTLEAYVPHLRHRLEDQLLTLSGGELQLLSLGCLELMLEGDDQRRHALLLDEHTASLDSVRANQVMGETVRFVRRYKLAGLAVTHSIELAARYGDTILLMEEGRIVERIAATEDGTDRAVLRQNIQERFQRLSLRGSNAQLAGVEGMETG